MLSLCDEGYCYRNGECYSRNSLLEETVIKDEHDYVGFDSAHIILNVLDTLSKAEQKKVESALEAYAQFFDDRCLYNGYEPPLSGAERQKKLRLEVKICKLARVPWVSDPRRPSEKASVA